MSGLTFVFIARLPQLAAVVGAVILAYRGMPGWGWMIFLALMLDTSVKLTSK